MAKVQPERAMHVVPDARWPPDRDLPAGPPGRARPLRGAPGLLSGHPPADGAGRGSAIGVRPRPWSSRASTAADADRGSAFSLLSAANATALAIGSIGGALVVENAGFEVALLATLGGMASAAVLALLDQGLGRTPIAEPRPAPSAGG